MTDVDDFTFDGCRTKLRAASEAVVTREQAYKAAIERAADAEAVYRSQLAAKLKHYRDDGKAERESLTLARADVAVLSRERDYSAGLVKLAAEKLENARDSRRSLWRLVEWARERDLIVARGQVGEQQQMVTS